MNTSPDLFSETDHQTTEQVALDYIESWSGGDAEWMEFGLHPDLAKRRIFADPRGFDRLEPISALGLVIATRRGVGAHTPIEQRRKDITILDGFGNVACVRVDAADWVDFLQLGKLNRQWQIVNMLWEKRPG
jgi:hypothetical protein